MLVLLLGISGLAPHADAAAELDSSSRQVPVHASTIELQPREQELREAVNAERRRNGLASLDIDERLERNARAHTVDMIRFGYFGHEWHDGRPFRSWIASHTTCDTTGEILAWSAPRQTSDHAVRQWLDSPSHRALLLGEVWTDMGVELTQRHAAVQFGRRC